MSTDEASTIRYSVNNKLIAPRSTTVFHRRKLLNYLDSVSSDLIWVSAPGGSGKTTLVADWLDQSKTPHIWLRLEESDSSLGTFFYNLALAARHSFPDDARELQAFTQEYSLAPATFAVNFFNSLLAVFPNDTATFVLDDYHELTDSSPVHEVINTVLEHPDHQFRFVVISRHSSPQVYLTLKATHKMTHLDWQDIQFSQADTRQLLELELSREISPEVLAYIQHEAGGWVSGIRLIASRIYESDWVNPLTKDSHVEVLKKDAFDYFALEVFASFNAEIKRLLIRTSFMPFFTSDMAFEISGVKKSFIYLEEFVRKNLFLQSHQGNPVTYRYHPLFQSFLSNYAQANMSAKEISEVSYTSARILSEMGAFEAAIEVFINNGFYDEARLLINEQSEALLKQGRIQQLLKWFEKIPEDFVVKEPKLLITLGKSQLLSSPEKACELFFKVIRHSIENNDKASAIEAYGMYLEALSISGRDYHLLEDCLYGLESLLENPAPETLKAAESIACVVLCSTSFVALNHPLQQRWKELAKKYIQCTQAPASLIKACNNMMIYYRFAGEDHSTYHLIDILSPLREFIESIPLLKLQTQVIDAFHYGYVLGKGEQSADICRRGIKEGLSTGIRLYEFWFRYILVLTLLRSEHITEAEEQITLLLAQYSEYPPVRKADILTLSAMCALYKKDLYKARHDIENANELFARSGASFPVIWSGVIMAIIKYELGDIEGSHNLLQTFEQKDWLGSAYAKYQALCLEAWIELNTDENSTDKLVEAFALASCQHFIFIPLIGRAAFIELCQRALHFGVETEYVRNIISEHLLVPDNPLCTSHLWPFPLKIYTLQPFKVIVTTSEGESELSLQPKSLELLKALIALGGYNVSIEKVCDALWGDSDGDAAYKSFKTTLYRLRKTLGSENHIVAKNNTLSFSRECWVDALCIWDERLLMSPKKMLLVRELVSLCHSPFLSEDGDSSWVVRSRIRISRNITKLLNYAAQTLLDQGKFHEAITYYEQALEIDPFEEDYYAGLMECYHNMRRLDRIYATYQRCLDVFGTMNQLTPSSRLSGCYENLIAQYSNN